jgi:hypothetical protein
MHYQVHDASHDGRAIALRDSAGKFHVARTTSGVPLIGANLHGARAGVGFGILDGGASGHVFRVIFEMINCKAEAISPRLHTAKCPHL